VAKGFPIWRVVPLKVRRRSVSQVFREHTESLRQSVKKNLAGQKTNHFQRN